MSFRLHTAIQLTALLFLVFLLMTYVAGPNRADLVDKASFTAFVLVTFGLCRLAWIYAGFPLLILLPFWIVLSPVALKLSASPVQALAVHGGLGLILGVLSCALLYMSRFFGDRQFQSLLICFVMLAISALGMFSSALPDTSWDGVQTFPVVTGIVISLALWILLSVWELGPAAKVMHLGVNGHNAVTKFGLQLISMRLILTGLLALLAFMACMLQTFAVNSLSVTDPLIIPAIFAIIIITVPAGNLILAVLAVLGLMIIPRMLNLIVPEVPDLTLLLAICHLLIINLSHKADLKRMIRHG